MTIDHKQYFELQKNVKPFVKPSTSGCPSQAEEIRYQAFKARLIEELQLGDMTPEQRAAWAEKMVVKK